MLKKILKLISIGRFENYSSVGNMELQKLNLIYGENSRGKTTISAIFRSLKTNTPRYILERSTIGSTQKPHVSLRVEEDTIEFKDGQWDKRKENLEIFDSHFITENVFSGDVVGHEHKKNLYRFVIGEKAVSKAQEVNRLDAEIKIKQTEINLREAKISKYISGKITVDKFIDLPTSPPDLDKQITEQEKVVETIKKSSTITLKPLLTELIAPSSPTEEVLKLLERGIAEVSLDAEKTTLEHINSHLGGKGQSWIQEGLTYIKDDSCPFCGQNIGGNSLIKAYQGYFNEAYAGLKKNVTEMIASSSETLGEKSLLTAQYTIDHNKTLAEFWIEYVNFTTPSSPLETLKEAWQTLSNQLIEHLNRKSVTPLDVVKPTKELDAAELKFSQATTAINAYNEEVKTINLLIIKKKVSATNGDLTAQTESLNGLQCLKSRNQPAANDLCEEFKKLKKTKTDLEEKKKVAKTDLDSFDKVILEKFETGINSYLGKFGAVFRVAETKKGYGGGTPSSSYCIVINGQPIELEGDDGEPSFKTILSNGDKNTLAFAFFMARLDQDTELDKKIAIFDDPITSLDANRKVATKQEILKISTKAKQTFVLSHDLQFLSDVWNDADKTDLNCLQATRGIGDTSTLAEWDISGVVYNHYLRDLKTLMEFVDGGSTVKLVDVARCIRPVLEGYLRMKLPKLFLPTEWLGGLIGKMRITQVNEIPLSLQNSISELSDINDYSKKYHHTTNSNADTEPIIEAELKGYVQRTLGVIGS